MRKLSSQSAFPVTRKSLAMSVQDQIADVNITAIMLGHTTSAVTATESGERRSESNGL